MGYCCARVGAGRASSIKQSPIFPTAGRVVNAYRLASRRVHNLTFNIDLVDELDSLGKALLRRFLCRITENVVLGSGSRCQGVLGLLIG